MLESDVFGPVLVIAAIAIAITTLVRIISDNKVRRTLVEKGMSADEMRSLFGQISHNNTPASLKWGMVLVAVGAALITIRALPRWFENEAGLGLIFIFAGVAFFAHFQLAKRFDTQAGND